VALLVGSAFSEAPLVGGFPGNSFAIIFSVPCPDACRCYEKPHVKYEHDDRNELGLSQVTPTDLLCLLPMEEVGLTFPQEEEEVVVVVQEVLEALVVQVVRLDHQE